MSPLNTAVSLKQINSVPQGVSKYLHLYMSEIFKLQVDQLKTQLVHMSLFWGTGYMHRFICLAKMFIFLSLVSNQTEIKPQLNILRK